MITWRCYRTLVQLKIASVTRKQSQRGDGCHGNELYRQTLFSVFRSARLRRVAESLHEPMVDTFMGSNSIMACASLAQSNPGLQRARPRRRAPHSAEHDRQAGFGHCRGPVRITTLMTWIMPHSQSTRWPCSP